jgi:hypothetical protein
VVALGVPPGAPRGNNGYDLLFGGDKMIKRQVFWIIIGLVVIVSVIFSVSILANEKNTDDFGEIYEEYIMNMPQEGCYVPAEGLVPDEETAKIIAIAVWFPIYGEENIDKRMPLRAKLVDDSLWLVRGTLNLGSDSDDRIVSGGVPYAKIRKSDGKILCVIHTE